MSKTGKRIFAAIMALVMIGGVVVSAGLFAGNGSNSGSSSGFAVDYSKGLDDNGYIEKVKASVKLSLMSHGSVGGAPWARV